MTKHRGTSGRTVPAILALALFLAGSNYCLVGALAGPGSRLGCGMTGHAGAASMPACHAHAAKGAPAPKKHAAPMPCCIALAPVVAPGIAKIAPAAVSDAPFALCAQAAPAAATLAVWVGHAPIAGAGPPRAAPGSPSEARAPPLA